MKHRLISLKNNEKVFINVVCCSRDWCLRVKSFMLMMNCADDEWIEFKFPSRSFPSLRRLIRKPLLSCAMACETLIIKMQHFHD